MAASPSPARVSRFIEHVSRPSSPISSFSSDTAYSTTSSPQPPPLSTSTSTASIATISGPSTPIQQTSLTPLIHDSTSDAVSAITPNTTAYTTTVSSDASSPLDTYASLTLEQCLAQQRAWEDKRISLATSLPFNLEIVRIDDADYVVPVRPAPRSLVSSGNLRPLPKPRMSSMSTATLASKSSKASELSIVKRSTRNGNRSERPLSVVDGGLESVPYEQTETPPTQLTPLSALSSKTNESTRRYSSMSAYALPSAIPEEVQVSDRRIVSDPVRSATVVRRTNGEPKRTQSLMRRFSTKVKSSPSVQVRREEDGVHGGVVQVEDGPGVHEGQEGAKKKRLSRLAFWR